MESPDPKDILVGGGVLIGLITALTAFFRFGLPVFRNGKNGHGALESAHMIAQLTQLERLVSLQEQAVRELGALKRILVEHAIQIRGVEMGVEAMLQDPRIMERARVRFRQDLEDTGA